MSQGWLTFAPRAGYAVTMLTPATRRDLLIRAGGGLGGVALAWLLGRDGRADAPKAPRVRGEGQARHLPVHGRRAQPDRPVRPQAGPGEVAAASRLPESFGRPVSQFTKRRRRHSCPARGSSPSTASAASRCPTCCPTWPAASTTSAFLRSLLVHQHGPRPGHVRAAQRPHADGLPQPRLVGDLRPRQRQRQPAGLLRAAPAGGRARGRCAVLGGRLPAGRLPGHAPPPRGQSRPQPEAAGRTSAAPGRTPHVRPGPHD